MIDKSDPNSLSKMPRNYAPSVEGSDGSSNTEIETLVEGSRISRFGLKLREFFVKDLPVDLLACESCREPNCTQERWETCAIRLEIAKQVDANH